MRTAIAFRPLLLGSALFLFASVAWGDSAGSCSPKAATKAVAAGCCAAAAKACAEKQTTTAAVPAAAEAGMRAYLDPESGVIGGVGAPQELEGVQSEPPVLEEIRLPDGSYMVDLRGTGEQFMILEIDANGQRVVRCGDDPAKLLAPPATAAKAVK